MKTSTHHKTAVRILVNYELYIFLLPAMLYLTIFHYAPMYGVQIAFKDFSPVKGILGSTWVGFENFTRFFRSYHFWTIVGNTTSHGYCEATPAATTISKHCSGKTA